MATITTASALRNIASAGKRIVATQTDPLNLRQAPTTSSLSILKIPRGATVDTLNCTTTSGWTAVRYNATEGFVASQYLAPVGAALPTVSKQVDIVGETTVTPRQNNSSMGEKIRKYGKYVLIVAGVGIVAFTGYKLMSDNSSGAKRRRSSGKSLGGVSLKPLKLK